MTRNRLQSNLVKVGFLVLLLLFPAWMRPHSTNAAGSASDIRITEVMFCPAPGSYEWIELKNTGTGPVLVNGFAITDEDDNWYRIPSALPAVPAGAIVVVQFDGAGSAGNDYNFSDGIATLHSPAGMTNLFEDAGDQVALYSAPPHPIFLPAIIKGDGAVSQPLPSLPNDPPPPSMLTFLAWGVPADNDDFRAVAAGLWGQGTFKCLARGLGRGFCSTAVAGESIGLVPNSTTTFTNDWTVYPATQVTKGVSNPWPTISWYYPPANSTLDRATFGVSWALVEGATGYRFQMDANGSFSTLIVNETLTEPTYIPSTPLAEGTYYWRVKGLFAGGAEGAWSAGIRVDCLTLPATGVQTEYLAPSASKILGIAWQRQLKDTNMLCLDGDPETTGAYAWDRPHTLRVLHEGMYCARACISMIASYFGGHLSKDRISYEFFKGGTPDGDLGHNRGVSDSDLTNVLAWALGMNPGQILYQAGKPAFAQIKAWIDANRPIIAGIPGHVRVLDGYMEFTRGAANWQFLHLLDPWNCRQLINYPNDNIDAVWVGPANPPGAPGVRSDEDVNGNNIADTIDDTDGDGLCDFDERNRFGTAFEKADTDGDLVPDKTDLREYVFNKEGTYSPRAADMDNDTRRKELDKDNDNFSNNGLMDGCEDSNFNGKCDSAQGETNNFKRSDDVAIQVTLSWSRLGGDLDLHLVRPGGAMFSGSDCFFDNSAPDWGIAGQVCDNPKLDINCCHSCTVENIVLSKLETGTYSIKVHYIYDYGIGSNTANVRLWFQGAIYTFGPRTLSNTEVWDVATLQWPSKVVTPGAMAASNRVDHGQLFRKSRRSWNGMEMVPPAQPVAVAANVVASWFPFTCREPVFSCCGNEPWTRFPVGCPASATCTGFGSSRF
jgi:hypothetical protein